MVEFKSLNWNVYKLIFYKFSFIEMKDMGGICEINIKIS